MKLSNFNFQWTKLGFYFGEKSTERVIRMELGKRETLSLIYDKCMQPGSRNRDKLMH